MSSAFSYYSYDLKSGLFVGQLPLRTTKFGQQLNTAQTVNGFIDLTDPRVRLTNPIEGTIPNKSVIVVDFNGSVAWGGVVMPRKRNRETSPTGTTRAIEVQCSELWAYFEGRVQATDYSSPPFSGITGEAEMPLWKAAVWDASLIVCQVIQDALLHVPFGDPLGGMGLLLNGATPSGSSPAAPSGDYISVNYPYPSLQTIGTIVSQICGLGLGVAPDIGVDLAYSKGPGSPLTGTINLSYPRRGRTVAENHLVLDLTTARGYSFPEDGSQTANTVYELGGSGAIVVDQNPNPLEQGYVVWERVMSRGSIQSQNIMAILAQLGIADLATYSYAPVTATVKMSPFDPHLPLGSFIVGDDVRVYMPVYAADGALFDEGFPAGMDQEWRIIAWSVEPKDEGDSLMELTLAQPPFLEALSPAI